jgi:Pretoxin HINT domain/A nuclease family of the HNH/ENDO VII superfamily with conserved AHH
VLNDPSIGTLEQFSYNLENCSAEGEGTQTCELCFAAGTPVHTDRGDVPIEKIQVGDEVIARNSKTGKLEKEPVTALTPRHTDALLELRIEAEHDALRPSTHHPFRARHGDDPVDTWVDSGKLNVGDLLETEDGSWRRITAINSLPGEQTVYNFTVDKDHDYFVGQTGFLVHNAGPCGCHNHHIVPRRDPRASGARDILDLAGIGINDPRNLVPLRPGYHLPIHTDDYMEDVEEMMERAWDNGGAQGVEDALGDAQCDLFNESFLP